MGVLDILAQQWTTLSLPANYSKAILHEYSTVEQGELTILHTLGTDISKMFNFFWISFFPGLLLLLFNHMLKSKMRSEPSDHHRIAGWPAWAADTAPTCITHRLPRPVGGRHTGRHRGWAAAPPATVVLAVTAVSCHIKLTGMQTMWPFRLGEDIGGPATTHQHCPNHRK